MIDGFAESLKIPTEMLNVLERPVSSSVYPWQTMIGLIMSIFPGEEAQKEEEKRTLWNKIVNHGMVSLGKEDRHAGTASYLSTKRLGLECMKAGNGRVRSSNERGRAGRMARMDRRIAEYVPSEGGGPSDSEFRRTISDNDNRLLATVRS